MYGSPRDHIVCFDMSIQTTTLAPDAAAQPTGAFHSTAIAIVNAMSLENQLSKTKKDRSNLSVTRGREKHT